MANKVNGNSRKMFLIFVTLLFVHYIVSVNIVLSAVVLNATDYIAFNVSGSEKARITSTGLGIGKTPSYPLDIVGTGYFSGNLYVSGNIGIGTTSPTHKLEIAGNVNLNGNTLYIKDVSGSKYGIGYGIEGGSELTLFSDNIITFTESDSDVVRAIWSMNEPYFNFDSGTLYINGTSNMVGIGTTSPSYKLHVAGDIYSSGAIYQNGKQVIDTISAGSGISVTGSGSSRTISLTTTGVSSGTYGSSSQIPVITVDSYGRITSISTQAVSYSETDPQVATTTSGRVCYGTGSAVTCNDNLYWDSSNDRLAIGTTSASSRLYVYAPDTAIADIYAVGSSQGTGMVYVGQSTSYGGGIVYNGDDNPDLPFTTDAISFFRRSGGTDYEVFYFMHNSNTVYFNGDINMKDHNILDVNTLTVNTIYDPEDAYLSISDHVYFTVNGTRIYLKSLSGQTYVGIYTSSTSDRLFIRAENTDNVAQFASYGLYLPQDVSTGLYVTGGMRVNYGGSEFVVDNSGNVNADSGTFYVDAANNRVGVGTTSPSEKLHVIGDVRIQSDSDVTTTVGSGALQILNSAGTAGVHIDSNEIQAIGGDLYINNDNAANTHINNLVHVTTGGNVGIGTSSPSEKLDVSGGIKANYFTDGTSRSTSFWGSSADIAVNSVIYTAGILHQGETGAYPAGITFGNGNTEGNDQISLITNGATRLYVNSAGNIGIGTTSPAQKLDVNGNALIRNTLYFDTNSKSQIYWDSGNNRLVIKVV